MNDDSVSIVVPTYRRPQALDKTLEAILDLERSDDYELIVVDNAGDPATEAIVRRAHDRWPAVRYERFTAGGAASARNRGGELAQGQWLLFCDDDVIPVQEDHFARHLRAHAMHPKSLVAGEWALLPDLVRAFETTPFGRYRLELEHSFRAGVQARRLEHGRLAPEFVDSNNLSIERRLFMELGGFDPSFPWAGAEDQDFSLRARQAGCTLVLDPSIHLHHNDRRLSLKEFCVREERSAQTIVVLARNFPAEAGKRALLTENRPVSRADRPGLIAKKVVKRLLSSRAPLVGLHVLTSGCERLPRGERILRRLYRTTIGLHIFRGVRTGLASGLRGSRGRGRYRSPWATPDEPPLGNTQPPRNRDSQS